MHQAADKLQEIAAQVGLDPLSLAVGWVARHKASLRPLLAPATGTSWRRHCRRLIWR